VQAETEANDLKRYYEELAYVTANGGDGAS
jgi:hypothetical protein